MHGMMLPFEFHVLHLEFQEWFSAISFLCHKILSRSATLCCEINPFNLDFNFNFAESTVSIDLTEDIVIEEDVGEILIPIRRSGDLSEEFMAICSTMPGK